MKKPFLKIVMLFVLSIGLFPLFMAAQEDGVKLRVVSDLANVRLRPDIGSTIIKQFPKGSILDSDQKTGEWFQVKFKAGEGERLTGYVHESLVQLVGGRLPEKIILQEEYIGVAEIKTEKMKKEEKSLIQPPEITPPVEKKEEKKEPKKEPEKEPEKVVEQRENIPSEEPALSDEYYKEEERVSVLLSLGGQLASVGDLNAGAQGLGNYYEDQLGVQGRGEVSDLKAAFQFGAEFLLPLKPGLSFFVGADYLLGNKESNVDLTSGPALQSFTSRPKIQALPVRVGLVYFPISGFYAKAGVEFIITNCRYFYRFVNDDFWQQWDGDASSQGFGLSGGMGYIFHVNSIIGVFAEASGRYARIKGLEGKDHFTDSTGSDSTENGKLYIYQGKITGSHSYSLLFVRDKFPSEGGVSDAKEAVLNLSGFSLKVGVRIRF